MLFAAGGYNVTIYDIEALQLSGALDNIKTQLAVLEEQGLLRGSLTKEQQYKLISTTNSLPECVAETKYIQV